MRLIVAQNKFDLKEAEGHSTEIGEVIAMEPDRAKRFIGVRLAVPLSEEHAEVGPNDTLIFQRGSWFYVTDKDGNLLNEEPLRGRRKAIEYAGGDPDEDDS